MEAPSWEMVPGCPSSIQAAPPSSQEYKELKGNGPFTIFVPHADLMTNLSQVTQPPEQRWGGTDIPGGGHCVERGGSQGPPLPSRLPLQDELARIRTQRQLVFRYHVVGCRQLRSQELLEEGYVTTLSGHPLRFSEREVSSGPAPGSAWSQHGSPQTQDSAAFKPRSCTPVR